MEKKSNNLDLLKENNPFKVPEGYMEGLTSQIMDQLPEKIIREPQKVTLMDRVRPWLYLAAVFAGLGLFFNLLVGEGDPSDSGTDSLFVQSATVSSRTVAVVQADEDEEYLEYLEAQYANYILTEEWSNYE